MCMEELEHWAFGLFLKYSLELLLLSFQKVASQISIHLYTAPSFSLCELGQFIPLPCLWFPQVLVHEALLLSNRLASASSCWHSTKRLVKTCTHCSLTKRPCYSFLCGIADGLYNLSVFELKQDRKCMFSTETCLI